MTGSPDLFPSPDSDELPRATEWLRRLALRLAADEASADDLLQETWLAMRRAGEDRLELAAGFLGNLARRQRRSRARRAFHEHRAARGEALPSAQELASGLETQRALLDELEGLPSPSRELLLLRLQRGLSAAAIARARGVPASTIRDQLGRAEHLLRQRLDRRYGGRRGDWAPAFLLMARGLPPLGLAATTLGALASMKLAVQTTAVALLLLLGAYLVLPRDAESPSTAGEGARSVAANQAELETARVDVERSTGVRQAVPTAVLGRTSRALEVVDARTQDPAAHYAVDLEVAGEVRATLVTDEQGRVELPAEHLVSGVRLRAVDHPKLHLSAPAERELTRDELDDGEQALRFEVELGPTYRLQLDAPPPDDAGAELASYGFSEDMQDQRIYGTGVPLRAGSESTGFLPWVRLDPADVPKHLEESAAPLLRIADRRGYYQAWGQVASTRWSGPELVNLQSLRSGVLEARVTVDGELPTTTVHASLQRQGEWLPDSRSVRSRIVSPEGMWRPGQLSIAYLDAGEWTLDLSGDGLNARRIDLLVETGKTLSASWDMKRVENRHSIDVHVRSESGKAPLRIIGALARRGEQVVHATPLYDSEEAELHLRFEGLEGGSWRIEPTRTNHLPDFEPGGLEVPASTGLVEFTCLDGDIAWRPTEVELVDAASGKGIERATVSLWVNGKSFLTTGLTGGHAEIEPIRPDASVDIACLAPGYRAVLKHGLQLPSRGPLRIEMESGWGVVLEARAMEAAAVPPLEGLHVQVDGRSAGRTDSLGRLLLTAAKPPLEIRAELEGWTYVHGDVDASDGALTSPAGVSLTRLWFRAAGK